MTTVVFDGKTSAADSQATVGRHGTSHGEHCLQCNASTTETYKEVDKLNTHEVHLPLVLMNNPSIKEGLYGNCTCY